MEMTSCRPLARRGRRAGLFALLLLLVPLAWADDSAGTAERESWNFRWDKGFKLDSPDGDFKLAFGGRINLDFSFPDADDELEDAVGAIEDASEFRRARIVFSGSFYQRLEFKMEFDFAGGDSDPTDVYLGILDTPVGNVRIGHFHEPFSIEVNTSSKHTTFIERGSPGAFSPFRNVGVMLHDTAFEDDDGNNGRLYWGVGVFRESDGFAFSRGDRRNVTGRIAGLPVFEDGGRRLLHLGLSLSRKDVDGEPLVIRQRPEVNSLPRLADVGGFLADEANLGALEFALNSGSFHAQAEYLRAEVDAIELGELDFAGYYVQVGYFPTGEHRTYNHGRAGFKRLKPKSVFGKADGGSGAWEIAARYSTLDLTDGPVIGGVLDGLTLALNWYLNPVTRFQLNYISSELEDVGGVDTALVRLQVDF